MLLVFPAAAAHFGNGGYGCAKDACAASPRSKKLPRYPGATITGTQHAHPLAHGKDLIVALNDGKDLTVIEFHLDLKSVLLGYGLFSGIAKSGSGQSADNRTHGTSASTTDQTAEHTAGHAAANGAEAAIGIAFYLHLMHGFDRSILNGLGAARLISGIGASADIGAAGHGKQRGGQHAQGNIFDVPHKNLQMRPSGQVFIPIRFACTKATLNASARNTILKTGKFLLSKASTCSGSLHRFGEECSPTCLTDFPIS